MYVIFIHGSASAGKYTIGSILSERIEIPLYHNHLAVDLALMGKWESVYQELRSEGVDVDEQLTGTTWLDRFIPNFDETRGNMLDMGCGLGADMLRCAKLGYEPHGLDLEAQAVEFVQSAMGFRRNSIIFSDPLPFTDATFSLVLSRFALHYLRPVQA